MSRRRLSSEIESSTTAEEMSEMYSPLNEDLMMLRVKQSADEMRGLRGDRVTRRAVVTAPRRRRTVRRAWHLPALLAR
jgi:hypothetical protein